ncbi:unnamed protein product [Didymodactylos carnosus]|uniref:Uncharacterized protein n=1 Tax=Didymodactylos carnosus TaxID=1234261 RepID=A0A814J9I5_9BILA|nr:unnamed protein product [Didymodactylos carnosus]CAF1034487.1 unnamed protein product [Didymodactylos carnosus]CAF3740097.1 unnamed protein product [Didymodactylos carnosus]CAF3805149.1 unnamed protein product [Didymodactylos carnosus]
MYDLMTMAIKYQVTLCPRANDIKKVTFNHVNAIRKLIKNPNILELLDKAYFTFNQHFDDMNDVEWLLVRHTILIFFQDIHIRVSIFLKENVQTSTGRFLLPIGGCVPSSFQVPGEIRTYKRGRLQNTNSFNPSESYQASDNSRPFKLGSNMYSKNRSVEPVVTKPMTSSSVNATSDIDMINPDPSMISQLNLLSSIIGNNRSESKSNFIKLSLFNTDDDSDEKIYVKKPAVNEEKRQPPSNNDINIDVTKRGHNSKLMNVINDFSFDKNQRGGKNDNDEDDDDLCAMMDRLPPKRR